MAVTNREEMRSAVLTQVRQDQIRILVHFVRILWTETRLGCEREFGDTVIELLLRRLCRIGRWSLWYRFRCRDFPGDRCTDGIAIPTISSLLGRRVGIRGGRMVWILPLFLGGLASLLSFTYFRELIDRSWLFGL